MESKLNGLAISRGVSTDEVVRTIQALISAGYKGDELLEKIDEIYGVGARNNLLKVVDYEIPSSKTSITVSYPDILPSEKIKVGDCLIGSNGCVGQIIDIEFDKQDAVSSATILGLGVSTTPKENLFEIQSILYEDLVNLKNNNQLVPGKQYRITDYVATVYDENNVPFYIVEEHPFDIIVVADSTNTLNENARACIHDGDNYYSMYNSDLSKWELKYSLSNDKNRFYWADMENGKGVIYYLKDDRNNICTYDFKEIKFLRYKIVDSLDTKWQNYVGKFIHEENEYGDYLVLSDTGTYFFTFSFIERDQETGEHSIFDSSTYNASSVRCYNNNLNASFKELSGTTLELSNVVFLNYTHNNSFGYGCKWCTFNDYVTDNIIGNKFYKNVAIYLFSSNTVGNGISSCFIGSPFSNNQIGNNNINLIILTELNSSSIGSGLYNLIIRRDDDEVSKYDIFMNGISQKEGTSRPLLIDLTDTPPGTVIEYKQ